MSWNGRVLHVLEMSFQYNACLGIAANAAQEKM